MYECTDDQHGVVLVDVFAAGDDVPFLAGGAITASDLNGSEVGAEISGEQIYRQTFSVWSLQEGNNKYVISHTGGN